MFETTYETDTDELERLERIAAADAMLAHLEKLVLAEEGRLSTSGRVHALAGGLALRQVDLGCMRVRHLARSAS